MARALVARGEPVELGRTPGSNAEARALLGFKPAYTMFDMVDEAVAAKAGAAR